MGNTKGSLLDANKVVKALKESAFKMDENMLEYRRMYWTPTWKEIEPVVQMMHDDGHKVSYLQYGCEESLIEGDYVDDGTDDLFGSHGQVGWVKFYTLDDLEITYCNAVVWSALGEQMSHISFYDNDDNVIWFDG